MLDYCVANNPSVATALSGQAAWNGLLRSPPRNERFVGMTVK
jgi:hypothetical protein